MKLAQRIYNDIEECGVSISDLWGRMPRGGFLVPRRGGVSIHIDEFSIEEVDRFILGSGIFEMGSFIEAREFDETVYLDYCMHFDNLSEAEAFGREQEQDHIYSVDTPDNSCGYELNFSVNRTSEIVLNEKSIGKEKLFQG